MPEQTTPVASQAQPTARPLVTKPADAQSPCDNCVKGGIPMKREWLSLFTLLLLALSTFLAVLWINEKRQNAGKQVDSQQSIPAVTQEISNEVPPVKPMTTVSSLPKPDTQGTVSLEETLQNRRSRREYADKPVSLQELSQLLWSAQGVTDDKGHRTAPSGHSVYPYTVYVVVRNVTGLEPGLYQYMPEKHELGNLGLGNAGDMLTAAGVQEGAQKAPVVMVLSAAFGKMAEQYPKDPRTPAVLEAGHIGQNIYLQLEALEMGGVVMAGFNPQAVGESLKLHSSETVVYVVPVGHRAPAAAPQE